MPAVDEATRLRVLFVLEGLAFGGCPVNAVDLAVTLGRRGHDIKIVAVEEEPTVSILPYLEQEGLTVELLPREAGLLTRARQLRRVLDEHGLSVVHVYAPWLGRAATVSAGTRRDRAAVVLNWTMENEFSTTRRTPLVVGTGEMRDEAAERLGEAVWLLEPPVDLVRDSPDPSAGAAFRAEHGISPDDLLLTLVGRVDRIMKLPGILRAMDAVAHLGNPRVRLAIVGDGNAMEVVRARADEVNAALGRPAVILTGSLDDPHPAYSAADVGLAMGGSALRVLAHATPLVVLGEGVFSKVYEPSATSYFERAGFYGHADPAVCDDPLADQIAGLLSSTATVPLGAFGRSEVERRHGMEAAADLLERAYRDALERRSGPLAHAGDIAYLVVREWLGRTRTRITEGSRGIHARPDHRPEPARATGPEGLAGVPGARGPGLRGQRHLPQGAGRPGARAARRGADPQVPAGS